MDERVMENESKVPFFGDIPVLGHLFKSTSSSVEKRNLMVFIKPTIIRDGVTADGITQRKYNYIRAEQLFKTEEGLKLLPDELIPVLPEFETNVHRYPAEVQAFIEQLELEQ
jgi:general secretion pathway protein D